MLPEGHLPWAGHMGLASAPDILDRVGAAGLTIIFVNTRAQAELMFQDIWRINEETLPIAIHHGSLDVAQRRKVEAAMAAGKLRAVIATASLDLGIDWGGVDQVIQVGAPKGVSRLLQRVGRANHRMDETSHAILVPANRFEVLECEAARQGVAARELDGDPPRPGGLDVLAQHLLGLACAGPYHPDAAFAEVTRAAPYAALGRPAFDAVLGFVENGGYALQVYERYRKLFRDSEGFLHIRNARVALQYRMNVGTIVEAPMIRLRLVRGPVLGEVEEWFVSQLREGDTFMFAGRLLRFLRLRETWAEVVDGGGGSPKVPTYEGARMPEPVQEWLSLQQEKSVLPGRDDLLVETFPRQDLWYLVAYCFEGRNAHQTLGMLLTRRMERLGIGPLGFVATDYVIAIWSAHPPRDMETLFSEDMMGDDLESWMAETSMLRRIFRNVAVISGLVDRQMPGAERNRRQVTVNTDLIYDVLRRHQPDHILLRATWEDAKGGLTDLGRVAAMLQRVRGRVRHMALDHVSPLAVPVILDVGRERVAGMGQEDLLAEAEALVKEATGEEHPENVLAQSSLSELGFI
jgi:ATP-dependent Lhr-like helicase